MNKLYYKSEINFTLLWIILYVVGTSITDNLSAIIGLTKSVTLVFHLILSAILFLWLKRNGLFERYGLCKPTLSTIYYIPLVIISTCNLWLGIKDNISVTETLFYIGSMLCVGFLEELIFRGFLFKAMSKDSITSAIIVSSFTFGIGHIVNLFNGSGMALVANLCQICYAVAFGFMYVILFHKGKSLIPCILSHSILNALSVFSSQNTTNNSITIIFSLGLCLFATTYTLVLLKKLPD